MQSIDATIHHVLDDSPTAAAIVAPASGSILHANQSLLTLLGWPGAAAGVQDLTDIFVDPPCLKTLPARQDASHAKGAIELDLRRADGMTVSAEVVLSSIEYRAEPAYIAWITTLSPRPRTTADARHYPEMLWAFVENSPANIQMKDLDGRFLMVNPAFERLHGRKYESITGKSVSTTFSTELAQDVTAHDREVLETAAVVTQERREVKEDGSVLHRSVTKFPIFNAVDQIIGIGSIGHDISQKKQAEELLHSAIAAMSDGFALFDADERLVMCNDNYKQIFSAFADRIVPGISFEDMLRAGIAKSTFPSAHGRAEAFIVERLARFRNPAGPTEYRQTGGRWIRSEEKKIANGGTVSIRSDITERRHAIEALRESEAQLRLMTDALPVLIAYVDYSERYVMINRTGAKWYGLPANKIIGKYVKDILGEQYEIVREPIKRALRGQKVEIDHQVTHPDGVTRDIRAIYVPHIDATGQTVGIFAMVEDTTVVNQTQAWLRQSQKMEALGQVTGGVAHEFNNLLMAISGNLELLLEEELKDMPAASAEVIRVLESAFRGKDLTGRLLSYTGNPFSVPVHIDVGEAARRTVQLLQPLLGETVVIDLETAPDLWPVRVDESEFENAIMNLALNGRDAMPEGGRIRIECSNVTLDRTFSDTRPYRVRTGDYVKVSVRDTGTGMSPETAQRAFDPFYTTKEFGKGTGLGLSMVYGFVRRQSQGYIDIESSIGDGTCVSFFLPRNRSDDATQKVDILGEFAPRTRQQHTALIVEDNAELCQVFFNMLESLNFSTVFAQDVTGALQILNDLGPTGHIDLLLTDVILPGGKSGFDLAVQAQERWPDMKTILISGYPEADLVAKGLRKNQFPLLSKPFRKTDLLAVLEREFTHEDTDKTLSLITGSVAI